MEHLDQRLTLASDSSAVIHGASDQFDQVQFGGWNQPLNWQLEFSQTTVAPSTLRIAAIGDSMTYEGGGSYVSVLRNLLSNSTATIQSFASAGWKADTLLSVWENEVRGKGFNTIIVFAGVPDLSSVNSTAEAAFRSLETLYNDATSRGIRVISIGLSPWAQYKKWTAERQVETLRLNDLLSSYAAAHPGTMRFVDAYNGLGSPDEPQRLSPRYDVGDGLHLVPTGDEELARLVSTALLSLKSPELIPQSAVITFNRAVFGLTPEHIQLKDAGTALPVDLVPVDSSHYRIDFSLLSDREFDLAFNLDLRHGPIIDSRAQPLWPQPDAILPVDYQIPLVSLALDLAAISAQPARHIRVTFSEPVTNLNVNNFKLLRDRIHIAPLIGEVTRIDESTFDLVLDPWQTTLSGTYQLAYEPTLDVQDKLGNQASRGALLTWVKLDVVPSISNNTLNLPATSGPDNIEVIVRQNAIDYTISGMELSFPRTSIQRVEVKASAGRDLVSLMIMEDSLPINVSALSTDSQDRAYLYDSSGNDLFAAGANRSSLTNTQFELVAMGFAQVTAISRSGSDAATFIDSSGADSLEGRGWLTTLKGPGYEVTSLNFASVLALSQNGGADTADLYDAPGNDTVLATIEQVTLNVPGHVMSAKNFRRINVRATQGSDQAVLIGSTADERYVGQVSSSTWSSGALARYFYGFDQVDVSSGGGNDQSTIYDSPGNDVLVADSKTAQITNRDWQITVRDFKRANIYARSGLDIATFNGSAITETFTGQPTYSSLAAGGFATYAYAFDKVNAISGGGNDTAKLFGSAGSDYFEAQGQFASLSGTGFENSVTNYAKVNAYSQAGSDSALLVGTAATENVIGKPAVTTMAGSNFSNSANNFANVTINSGGGADIATLYDSAGDDRFIANPSESVLVGAAFSITAQNYVRVNAYATTGIDRAELTGSSGDEVYTGRPTDSSLKGTVFLLYVSGFDSVVSAGAGGNDLANFSDSAGDDQATVSWAGSNMTGVNYNNQVTDFDRVQMYASSGSDTAYYLDSNGNDRFTGSGSSATITGSSFIASLQRFKTISLSNSQGGTNQILLNAITYQLNVGTGWNR